MLTSFRPGGFEARVIDERVPLTYGVIGQETQGPGGFFMALRSITAMRPIIDDVRAACPGAVIFNYTNPVNVVSQAVADHTEIPIVSLCEGPIVFPAALVEALSLDPELLDVASVGLNHGSWSVTHDYDGRSLIPILQDAWENADLDRFPGLDPPLRRMLQLAATMGSIPSGYFQYYYFERELLRELQAKSTTRGRGHPGRRAVVLGALPRTGGATRSGARPAPIAGGIHELELALDCMDSVFNHKDETMTVNVPNRGTLPGFADNLVIETLGTCTAEGIQPLPMPPLPTHTSGLVEALASYQQAAADAAWGGDARDASEPSPRTPWCARSTWPRRCTPRCPTCTGTTCPIASWRDAAGAASI